MNEFTVVLVPSASLSKPCFRYERQKFIKLISFGHVLYVNYFDTMC